MLKGYREESYGMANCWMVPSTRWFSKIVNWNEFVNWGLAAATTFLSLALGIGFIVDPSIADLAAYIIFGINGVCSLPALTMLIFGYRHDRYDMDNIADVERNYTKMSRPDKRKYKKHLHTLYKDYDRNLASNLEELFKHYRLPASEKPSSIVNQAVEMELKAIEEGKRIYNDSLKTVGRTPKD